jgi:hypothetical protein
VVDKVAGEPQSCFDALMESEQTSSTKSGRPLLLWGVVLMAAFVTYFVNIGPVSMWLQKAPTRAEWDRRCKIAQKVYAPVIWICQADRSQTLEKILESYASLWEKKHFDPGKLPEK